MTASWEVAASRMTRTECLTFVTAKNLLAPGISLANIPASIRLRGVIDAVWYNDGDFDPNLAAGTELDWTTFKYVRGGLYKDGTPAKQWEVWSWCKSQYDVGPQAFLNSVFTSDRTDALVADPSPQTSTGGSPNKFYAPANKVIKGTVSSDRVFYPYGKLASGNPLSATVNGVDHTPTTSEVRLTLNREDEEAYFEGQDILFGAQRGAFATELSASFFHPLGSGLTATESGGFKEALIGSDIVVSGCNADEYNRVLTVLGKVGDSNVIVAVPFGSSVTSGKAIITDRQQLGHCESLVKVSSTEILCTFSPPLVSVPYNNQYATLFGASGGDDRSVQGVADEIIACPEGHRMMAMNSPLSFTDDANHKLVYHDFAGGGKALSFDKHWSIVESAMTSYFQQVKDRLDVVGALLNFCYLDWEGIGQWYYFNTTGGQDQVIEEHNAAAFLTKWGFPVDDCRTVGNQTTQTPETPVTENQFKYWLINAQNIKTGYEYVDKVAAKVKEIFGAQVVIQNFRVGSLNGWETQPNKPSTVQRSPVAFKGVDNLRPDSLAAWRTEINSLNTLVDLTASPPEFALHPLAAGDDDARGYAGVENACQFFQAPLRIFGTPTWPTCYGSQDETFHPGVANTRWFWDQITHQMVCSDIDQIHYFNKRSTDDKPMEDWLIELESVFPSGARVPQVLENPMDGAKWDAAYARSCCDNEGRYVWYYTANPLAGVTFTQSGKDVIIGVTNPAYSAYAGVKRNCTIFEPATRITQGTWFVQTETSGGPSWLEYIRSIVANAVEADRASGRYVFSEFEVIETYEAAAEWESIGKRARCYVNGMGADELRVTNSGVYETVQPVQVAFQAMLVKPSDLATPDTYAKLVQQIKKTCRNCFKEHNKTKDNITISFSRNEALRDIAGGAISYEGIRETNTFEAFWFAHYTFATSGNEEPTNSEV